MTQKVIDYFKQICSIPHGSGNCSKIADMLSNFGTSRGLSVYRDSHDNVIIKKPGVGRGINSSPVILQGHMDMVCTKTADADIDMAKDGLKLVEEGDILYAKNTSLGADDGIGVAMIMAALDNDSIDMPPIEGVITTDEETGMEGAAALDMSTLKGRYLINLDSEAEGEFTCGCAGGERIDIKMPLIKRDYLHCSVIELKVTGLKGGHSGCDIHRNRTNAITFLVRALRELSKEYAFDICGLNGGQFDNVICNDAFCRIVIPDTEADSISKCLNDMFDEAVSGLREYEPDIAPAFDVICSGKELSIEVTDDTNEVLDALNKIPQGVIAMNIEPEDTVETSANVGIIRMDSGFLKITYLIRSCVNENKKMTEKLIVNNYSRIGASYDIRGNYPAWSFVSDSRLRETAVKVYSNMFGKAPVVTVTHGGLECGYFSSGIDGIDCLSIGPQIDDIHSVREKISLSSIDRTVRFMTELLKEII